MSNLDDIQKDVTKHIEAMRSKNTNNVGMEDVLDQGKFYSSSGVDGSLDELPRRRQRKADTVTEGTATRKTAIIKTLLFGGAGLLCIIVIVIMSITLVNRRNKVQDDWADSLDEQETDFAYSDEEVELLRLNGYTGYEIEEYAALGYPADGLVEEAEAQRESLLAEEYANLFDSSSPEYQDLLNKTWLGQKQIPVDEGTEPLTKYTQNMNLDYEKVTASGYQLWLKLYVKDDLAIFMSVTPDRWNSLSDAGNIVVQLEYVEMSNGYIVITDITEIPT